MVSNIATLLMCFCSGNELPYWQAAGSRDWISVDFLALYSVTHVAIQGHTAAISVVTTFKLSYSRDGLAWQFVTDSDGAEQVRTTRQR